MSNDDYRQLQIAPPNPTRETRILIPAGIGDAYWVMVKMEAFCRREGIKDKPTIILLSEVNLWDQARLRSIPFLEMIPFIKIGDPKWIPVDPILPRPQYLQDIYDESRVRHGRTIYPGFMGYEYFISYNGIINAGHWLEDDGLECNWYFPLKESQSMETAKKKFKEMHGKYAVFFFSNFHDRMLNEFSIPKIIETINHFTRQSGLTPVFVGGWWDLRWQYLQQIINGANSAINIVGQTSLDEVFGIIQGAELISGHHCGLTNMAIVFKKKTILLWDYTTFPSVSPLAIAPPDTRNNTYIPLYTRGLTIDKYLKCMMDLYGGHR